MKLLASLALQNLGRRKARSLLMMAAVAVASGVVFTGATLMRSIDQSMAVGFTRLGADMMVVPEGALTNITAALLTVEPTDLVLDADAFAKASIATVGRAAPQKIARVEHSGIGSHHESADLIGFQQVIFLQDRIILENQRPILLPLEPRAEVPTRADASSIAYRRWLKEKGLVYGTSQGPQPVEPKAA